MLSRAPKNYFSSPYPINDGAPRRKKNPAALTKFFCDAAIGGKVYNSDWESLDRYFTYFALIAQEKYVSNE